MKAVDEFNKRYKELGLQASVTESVLPGVNTARVILTIGVTRGALEGNSETLTGIVIDSLKIKLVRLVERWLEEMK